MQLDQVLDDGEARGPGHRAGAWSTSPPAGSGRTRRQELGLDARCPSPRPTLRRASSRARARRRCGRRRGVNFTAFVSRFQNTCCRRPGSPRSRPARRIQRDAQSQLACASTDGLTASIAALMTSLRSTGCTSSCTLPEMMRLMSSRSSMICACDARIALDRLEAASRGPGCRAGSRRSSVAQPRIALSGVRSSCETVARNSSFSRPTRSASSRAARSALQQSLRARPELISQLGDVDAATRCSRKSRRAGPSNSGVAVSIIQRDVPSCRRMRYSERNGLRASKPSP